MSFYIPIGLAFWASAIVLIVVLNHYIHTHAMCPTGHVYRTEIGCLSCSQTTGSNTWSATTLHGGTVYDQHAQASVTEQVSTELHEHWASLHYLPAQDLHCGRSITHPVHLWEHEHTLRRCTPPEVTL